MPHFGPSSRSWRNGWRDPTQPCLQRQAAEVRRWQQAAALLRRTATDWRRREAADRQRRASAPLQRQEAAATRRQVGGERIAADWQWREAEHPGQVGGGPPAPGSLMCHGGFHPLPAEVDRNQQLLRARRRAGLAPAPPLPRFVDGLQLLTNGMELYLASLRLADASLALEGRTIPTSLHSKPSLPMS